MKKRAFEKKLSLKKQTIDTLNTEEMHLLHGGDAPTLQDTCPYVCPTNFNNIDDVTLYCISETYV